MNNPLLTLNLPLSEKCQIRSFFWSVITSARTEYGFIRSKSPYSVQIQKNTDQKKLRIWTLFTHRHKVNACSNRVKRIQSYHLLGPFLTLQIGKIQKIKKKNKKIVKIQAGNVRLMTIICHSLNSFDRLMLYSISPGASNRSI